MNGQDYFRQQILDTLPSTAHNREVFADGVAYFLGRAERTLDVPIFLRPLPLGLMIRHEAQLSREPSGLCMPVDAPNGASLEGSLMCQQDEEWTDRPQFWMTLKHAFDFSHPILERIIAPAARSKLLSLCTSSGNFGVTYSSMLISWNDRPPAQSKIDDTIDTIALLERIKNPSINYERLLAPHYRAAADAVIAAANAAGMVRR